MSAKDKSYLKMSLIIEMTQMTNIFLDTEDCTPELGTRDKIEKEKNATVENQRQ